MPQDTSPISVPLPSCNERKEILELMQKQLFYASRLRIVDLEIMEVHWFFAVPGFHRCSMLELHPFLCSIEIHN